MRKVVIAVALAGALFFAGLSFALANDDMPGPGGPASNNQAAGAAGVAATAGLVAGAAAAGGGATETAPDPAGTTEAGASPPDDSGPEFEGEGTPAPEEPSPECVACKAQWDLLAGQRTEARHRLATGLRSLDGAFANLRQIQGQRDALVSERNQALALGGLSIGVAMAYGGVIASRLAAGAASARGMLAICRIWGGAENAVSAATLTAQASSLSQSAMMVTGVDLAGGAGAAAAAWSMVNASLDQFDAAVQTSRNMADGLESACRDVEGSVQKIEAQMDSLKRQMAECGFDTDLGNAEEIPSWPKFWETSIRG